MSDKTRSEHNESGVTRPKADIQLGMDLRRFGPILLQNYFEHPDTKD
jgi:hypothetical protein